MRDAGDYGFGMSFEDAVKKGRAENWNDRDIAALLKCFEAEVAAIPREPVILKLEDLKFRDDVREGGKVIEYMVDGRVKTQTVPMMVGQVLDAQNKAILGLMAEVKVLKEKGNERSGYVDGRDGGSGRADAGSGRAGKEEKGKAPKARKGTR